MSYPVIDQNKNIAWDYPLKGCLFDKTKQRFAKCNREDFEGYLMLTGDVTNYLNRLDWHDIKEITNLHTQTLGERKI